MIVWPAGVVDYLSNAFTPDRAAVWDGAIEAAGVQVKVQHDPTDGFADPDTMVARMDELGVATVLLPACDVGSHGREHPFDFEHVASRWEEVESLAARCGCGLKHGRKLNQENIVGKD